MTPDTAATPTIVQPSASYSILIRARLPSRPGAFGQVATAIGDAGAILGAIDLVSVEGHRGFATSRLRAPTRRTASAWSTRSASSTASRWSRPGPHLPDASGRQDPGHREVPVKTRDDLSMAYTPGVARICKRDPRGRRAAWSLTDQGQHDRRGHRRHRGAGPGRHRPRGARCRSWRARRCCSRNSPASTRSRSAWTRPTSTRSSASSARRAHVRRHQPGGHRRAALLRDRAPAARGARHPGVPRRPARHRDRRARGAAQRAARRRQARRGRADRRDGRRRGRHGVREHHPRRGSHDVIVCDIKGALYAVRPDLDPERAALAERTNPGARRARPTSCSRAPTSPRTVRARCRLARPPCARWPPDAVVFAMANPDARDPARGRQRPRAIMATGRSDYPNQINNVLAFPGVFRGALDVRARRSTRR